jgi:predicted GIY-YIG superfamily endonuclease
MDEAIAREKQIKGGSRARKIALIEAMIRTGGISM